MGFNRRQTLPQFRAQPFVYHEVNTRAPENELWNNRYGLKIPVLHLYRLISPQCSAAPLTATHELETVLWDTPRWEWKKGKAGFTMEELCVMDFEKKKMKFEE